jgi:hypothetical protein
MKGLKRIITIFLIVVITMSFTVVGFTESIKVSQKSIYEEYAKKYPYEVAIEEKTAKLLSNFFDEDSIAQLVTSVEKEDKVKSMKLMILALEKIEKSTEESDLFVRYILKYAPYIEDIEITNHYKELNNNIREEYVSLKTTWTYNPSTAVLYARTNYNTYNTDFPDCRLIGGDCTNFVSQCLYTGGFPMNGSWYCYKKNSTYQKPINTTQLDYSWTLADPSPWISAKQFELKWYPIFSNSNYSGEYVYDNQSTIYGLNYTTGDIVQILEKNFWWYEAFHSMIITKKQSGDYKLTYHSTSSGTLDKPLNTIASSYTDSKYKFQFYDVEDVEF